MFAVVLLIERLRNENEDKTKTQMTQSFNQYSENETKIWRQNILNQSNDVSSSCLRSHFVTSLIWQSHFTLVLLQVAFYVNARLCRSHGTKGSICETIV